MASGLEIRSRIDDESVRGLLLTNGGGAVALLAFLPAVLSNPEFRPLVFGILAGLFLFQVGLVTAVAHNTLRRRCSLACERDNYRPSRHPTVCTLSTVAMWSSVAAFLLAGLAMTQAAS